MKKIYFLFLIAITTTISLQAKKIYCKYMKSCKEACRYYNQGYSKLDRDGDGIPCENVCHTPCKKIKPIKKKPKNTK